MIRSLLLAAALLAPVGGAMAQAHEPITGALSGRSPHLTVRPTAKADRGCTTAGHHLPAGKLAVFGAPRATCAAEPVALAQGGGGAPRPTHAAE